MLPVQQGRNEVRCPPWQEATLGAPCSNLRSFGSKCTALKKALVILLRISVTPAAIRCAPIVIRPPGNCVPISPLVTPLQCSP